MQHFNNILLNLSTINEYFDTFHCYDKIYLYNNGIYFFKKFTNQIKHFLSKINLPTIRKKNCSKIEYDMKKSNSLY